MKLRREVIAPDGPNRHDAVTAYRRRRKAIERGERFLANARKLHDAGGAMGTGTVVDEVFRLIQALKEVL